MESRHGIINNLKSVLIKYRNDRFKRNIEHLTTQDKTLWQATRRILYYLTMYFCLQKPSGDWIKLYEDKVKFSAQSKHKNTLNVLAMRHRSSSLF